MQPFAKTDARKSWCSETNCQRHGDSNKRFTARRDRREPKGRAAQPVTYPARPSNRDWVSFYSVRRWRVPSRMRFSSSRRSLQFPLWLLTSLARPEKLSLEESGKHQRGMRGISAFRFSPQPPPPTPLTPVLSLLWMPPRSRALEFSRVSECSPTITTSHKQWGLLIGGLRRRVAAAGPSSRFCWQRAPRTVLKVRKYRLHGGPWKI